MEFNSIAMIETNGLVSAITALEAMLKLGDIKFLKRETASNGQVALFIYGNVPQLNRTLQVGEIAANNVGNVIASSIIENPTKEILDVILDKITSKPKRSKKSSVKVEIADTLFDNVIEDAILEESIKPNTDNKIIVEEENLEIIEEHGSEKEVIENSVEDEEIASETTFIEEVVLEKEVKNESIEVEEENSEENQLSVEEVLEEKETEIIETPEIIEEIVGNEESSLEITDEKVDAKEDNLGNKILDETESVIEKTEIIKDEIVEDEERKEEQNEAEEERLVENDFSNMSHLERLRAEAKLELEDNSKSDLVEEKSGEDVAESNSEYSSMNVPQLRKLARSNPNFPIQGREISKANRKVLLEYFKQIS